MTKMVRSKHIFARVPQVSVLETLGFFAPMISQQLLERSIDAVSVRCPALHFRKCSPPLQRQGFSNHGFVRVPSISGRMTERLSARCFCGWPVPGCIRGRVFAHGLGDAAVSPRVLVFRPDNIAESHPRRVSVPAQPRRSERQDRIRRSQYLTHSIRDHCDVLSLPPVLHSHLPSCRRGSTTKLALS